MVQDKADKPHQSASLAETVHGQPKDGPRHEDLHAAAPFSNTEVFVHSFLALSIRFYFSLHGCRSTTCPRFLTS